MGFKSHIKKILCYLFKLKYLNQIFFYPTLKKHNFFFWEHKVYILMGFKSYIWKEKKHRFLAESCPSHGLTRRVDQVWPGRCTDQSFDKPGPVQTPGWPGPRLTHRAGPGLITLFNTIIVQHTILLHWTSLSSLILIVFELCFSTLNFKNVMSLGGNLAKLFRFEGDRTINSD